MEPQFETFRDAIGWSILHSLWQGIAIYLILYGLYISLPHIKAKVRYALAFVAQFAILICFIGTFFHLYSNGRSTTAALPFSDAELAHYVTQFQETTSGLEGYFKYIVPLYLLGVFIQSSLLGLSFLKLNQFKKQCNLLIPAIWEDRFNQALKTLNLRKKVQFMVSDKVSVPMTLGFIKPIVIFPIAYINQVSLAEVETLLLHELAHIKRHDYLFNMVKVSIETLLFFNPFIWLLSKHMELEREQACDDSVVDCYPNRAVYAKALLSVETLKEQTMPALAMAASGRRFSLLNRIKRITHKNLEPGYNHNKHQLTALILVALSFMGIAWTKPAGKEKEHLSAQESITMELVKQTEKTIQHTSGHLTFTDSMVIDHEQTHKLETTNLSLDTLRGAKKEAPPKENWELKAQKEDSGERFQKGDPMDSDRKETNTLYSRANSPEEWLTIESKLQKSAQMIEISMKNLEAYYNSPKWKAQVERIEKRANELAAYYNSPAFNEKIKRIEERAKEQEKRGREIESLYNSPAWKLKQAQIEQRAKEIHLRNLEVLQSLDMQIHLKEKLGE